MSEQRSLGGPRGSRVLGPCLLLSPQHADGALFQCTTPLDLKLLSSPRLYSSMGDGSEMRASVPPRLKTSNGLCPQDEDKPANKVYKTLSAWPWTSSPASFSHSTDIYGVTFLCRAEQIRQRKKQTEAPPYETAHAFHREGGNKQIDRKLRLKVIRDVEKNTAKRGAGVSGNGMEAAVLSRVAREGPTGK